MKVMSIETKHQLPTRCSPHQSQLGVVGWAWHSKPRACPQQWRVPCLCSALQDGIGKENITHRSFAVPFNLAPLSPPLNMSRSTTSTCFLKISRDGDLAAFPEPHEAPIKPPRQEKGVRGRVPPAGRRGCLGQPGACIAARTVLPQVEHLLGGQTC